jgi:hypothetical protein
VIRSFVGNPSKIDSDTRTLLVNEGVLAGNDGKFVERNIPERHPEYLAGVANGTITPNTSGGTSVQSQASRTPQRRPSQTQTQQAVFQPNQGNSAAPETELAANSEDDSEALRRFEQGLDDRLRRVEGQRPGPASTRTAQTTRRQASRADSSGRILDRNQTTDFIPSQPDVAPTQISGAGSAVAALVPEARLGQDTSRRGLADRQRNEALANMNGARMNPSATDEVGRSPASADGQFQPESALTLNVDSNANLERVLTSNESLRTLIQEQKPFRFKLNDSLFDVQFNNGSYTVSFRSGDNKGRTIANQLQGIFNNTLRRSPSADRNATLENLGNTLRN